LSPYWKKGPQVPLQPKRTGTEKRQKMNQKYLSYIPSEISTRFPLRKPKLMGIEVR
jgi:hypothetical protein